MASLEPRHIQDMSASGAHLVWHWGYGNRVVPCTNDAGSCEYLDAVYWMHDVGIIYSWLLWVVIGIILLLGALFHLLPHLAESSSQQTDPEATSTKKNKGSLDRFCCTVTTGLRKWLLPEAYPRVFGHASRLQVAVLACLLVYLLVFSLVGVVYKTWRTPIKGTSLHNTRTGFGPWGDRVGVLAYALTPLTIMLSSRESILSLFTGVPYQHFQFLHRWTGRIIYIQAVLHTLAWTLVEGLLYQPQPSTYREFIRQQYMVFGCVALVFISFLFFFSLRPVVRWTGYEFFRRTHYVVAVLYLGACWGHWELLNCWMIASLALFLLDRGMRLLRTALIHVGVKDGEKGIGFRPACANISLFADADATVVRLDFDFAHAPWSVGQHFFLCFPALSLWQSHPMTPASMPSLNSKQQHHTYIIRARKGMTRKLAELAASKDVDVAQEVSPSLMTPVILTGPYGRGALTGGAAQAHNVLAIAGGTGISFAMPVVFEALRHFAADERGAVELVWIIRKTKNLEWVAGELGELKRKMRQNAKAKKLKVKIFVTRESRPSSRSSEIEKKEVTIEKGALDVGVHASEEPVAVDLSSLNAQHPGFEIEWFGDHHPSLSRGTSLLTGFLERSATYGGRSMVLGSGPAGMGKDLRVAVAGCNDARKVWRGEDTAIVGFYWDDRLE